MRKTARGAGILAAVAALFSALLAIPAEASNETTTCRAVEVPFTVAGQTGPIAGTLCTPPGANVVQVLVHGWTYDQHYFDWPVKPETYSYARRANAAGYATLAIDRLGAGASLRPPSLFTTFNNNAEALHAVVTALRDGSLGQRFDKVVTVGHSLGSLTVAQEAGQFKDVDAVITTGFVHTINYTNVIARVLGRDHPAMGDPKFAAVIKDPLYMTSIPGTRASFYHVPNTDPAVIEADERLKGAASLVDFATGAGFNVVNVDRDLDIPVLVVTGDKDYFFCGLASIDCSSARELIEHERQWYGPNATIEAYMPPNTGHNTALEKTAPQSAKVMIDFVERHVGHGTGVPGTAPGKRPAIPSPPPTTPSPAAAVVAKAFETAVLPVANAYVQAVEHVPGLGDTSNPVPGVDKLLATVANTAHRFLGTLPAELVGAP
jgi:pimeloyl-ACP methyl ester carboxylesterase